MTRLNLVPPAELADQHLFAEFREIKMVPKSLARSLCAALRRHEGGRVLEYDEVGAVLRAVQPAYCLGAGHVSFFYDKGLYLQQRYSLLRHELRRRGIAFNEASLLDPDRVFERDQRLRNDYTPTPEALKLVRARIADRLALRPGWYRWPTTQHGATV